MSKSLYRRASQSRPLLGKSDCFIQSPCSRHRIFMRVSARLQATAAPDAPEPIISTSTISLDTAISDIASPVMAGEGPPSTSLLIEQRRQPLLDAVRDVQ